MTTKLFYKIINQDGYYFDNNCFSPSNHGQIFKAYTDALATARRLSLDTQETEITVETCVVVPVKKESMNDDTQIVFLRNAREKLKTIDNGISQHLFRMSLTKDVRDYPFVIQRNPIDKSENKFVKTEADIEYVISSKKTKWRYLSVKTIDEVLMLKLIMGSDFIMAVDLTTFEVLK